MNRNARRRSSEPLRWKFSPSRLGGRRVERVRRAGGGLEGHKLVAELRRLFLDAPISPHLSSACASYREEKLCVLSPGEPSGSDEDDARDLNDAVDATHHDCPACAAWGGEILELVSYVESALGPSTESRRRRASPRFRR